MNTPATSPTSPKSHKTLIALAGNPNCGKSALFNQLTGFKQRVANFPGVTVEKKEGEIRHPGAGLDTDSRIQVIDLPGTYSIDAQSPDEIIAQEIILGLRKDTAKPDAIVVIADSTHLERSLFLLSQLMEFGSKVILCLNMSDIAEKQHIDIDLDQAVQRLGIPVVKTVGTTGLGKADLIQTLSNLEQARMTTRPFSLDDATEATRQRIANGLKQSLVVASNEADFWAGKILANRWQPFVKTLGQGFADFAQQWTDTLKKLSVDSAKIARQEIEARHTWTREICKAVVRRPASTKNASDKLDKFLLHPVLGPLFFLGVMTLVFHSVFTWAGPLMDLIDGTFGALSDLAVSYIPEGMVQDLVVDGIIAGVGGVFIFLPQIMLLFLFIAILEDSGYLARAAFLVDRLMLRSGLSGKSFIPLLSSFACAIPGIMAARTIKHERDRLATILVAPLITCSARMPVYALLIGTFVPATFYLGVGLQGLTLLGLYLIGIIGAVVAARVMRKTILSGPKSMLVLELPDYKMPRLTSIAQQLKNRMQVFVLRVGKIIFTASVILWALAYFPRNTALVEQLADQGVAEQTIQQIQLEKSFAGQIGKVIEPAIEPLGYDWKVGIGLLASFAAREVFVASMGTLYSIEDASEESPALKDALINATTPAGSRIFTLPMVLGLLVFFAFALQCLSTVAVIQRETGTWRWAIFSLVYMYGLAYTAAWATYRVTGLFL